MRRGCRFGLEQLILGSGSRPTDCYKCQLLPSNIILFTTILQLEQGFSISNNINSFIQLSPIRPILAVSSNKVVAHIMSVSPFIRMIKINRFDLTEDEADELVSYIESSSKLPEMESPTWSLTEGEIKIRIGWILQRRKDGKNVQGENWWRGYNPNELVWEYRKQKMIKENKGRLTEKASRQYMPSDLVAQEQALKDRPKINNILPRVELLQIIYVAANALAYPGNDTYEYKSPEIRRMVEVKLIVRSQKNREDARIDIDKYIDTFRKKQNDPLTQCVARKTQGDTLLDNTFRDLLKLVDKLQDHERKNLPVEPLTQGIQSLNVGAPVQPPGLPMSSARSTVSELAGSAYQSDPYSSGVGASQPLQPPPPDSGFVYPKSYPAFQQTPEQPSSRQTGSTQTYSSAAAAYGIRDLSEVEPGFEQPYSLNPYTSGPAQDLGSQSAISQAQIEETVKTPAIVEFGEERFYSTLDYLGKGSKLTQEDCRNSLNHTEEFYGAPGYATNLTYRMLNRRASDHAIANYHAWYKSRKGPDDPDLSDSASSPSAGSVEEPAQRRRLEDQEPRGGRDTGQRYATIAPKGREKLPEPPAASENKPKKDTGRGKKGGGGRR